MARRRKAGDVYTFRLPDGKWGFVRVMKDAAVAVYKHRGDSAEDIPADEEYEFCVCVYSYVFGNWRFVENPPFENEDDAWVPFCWVDGITQKGSLYIRGEKCECTYEECKGLEILAVWDECHLFDRMTGETKWQDSMKRPLPQRRKPEEERDVKQAVVFSDVDGTLVSEETGEVPASVGEAMERLIANGHIPAVNTGRPFAHVIPQVRALPIRSYVCSCGMYVLADGSVVQDCRPSLEICLAMRELVLKYGFDCLFESNEAVYYVEGNVLNFNFGKINHENGVLFSSDVMSPDFRFDKFVVWYKSRSDYERFAREAGEYFTLIERSSTFTELVFKGCSKGLGMKKLLESLPPAERTVVAFGDGPNDVEMFRAADVRVLMGNGTPSLRASVDLVTDTVENDGILRALERLGLI